MRDAQAKLRTNEDETKQALQEYYKELYKLHNLTLEVIEDCLLEMESRVTDVMNENLQLEFTRA